MPPAERDPIAVKLLAGYPQPNTPPLTPGAVGRYQVSSPNIQNTRQEVIRMDYDWSDTQRFWGRYTHDLSETRELGGLFFGTAIPGVAGTDTTIPGQVGGVRPAQHHRRQQAERAELSLQQQQHLDAAGRRREEHQGGLRRDDSRSVSRERRRPDSDHRRHRPQHARRESVVPHPVHQSLDHRQLLVAARQACLQDGRPRDLRAEE